MAYPLRKLHRPVGERTIVTYRGYAAFGPTLAARMQPPVGLTDRGTGTVYFLAADAGPPARLKLATTAPLAGPVDPHIFPAWDGPFLTGTVWRLLVRDGRLGLEEAGPHLRGGRRLVCLSPASPFSVRYEVLPALGAGTRLAFSDTVDW